ncbi:MAG: pyridoxamine 5'-phosphate oxidase family protein [Firmicutes bacterium]|nr:pyridoxamine 5'-phosphate oxidase family protein [Bacillota bacterium]
MRRKDREITDLQQILAVIDEARVLRMALFDGAYPYIVPLHFGYEYEEDRLVFYMHCAKEGHKLDLIKEDPHACVEVEGEMKVIGAEVPCKFGAIFSSVVARGRVQLLQTPEEKIHGLQRIMKQQSGKDFAFDETMAAPINVLKFTADEFSAKARTK